MTATRAPLRPPPQLPPLSSSARAALVRLATMLADGFTGEVELQCSEGGVKVMRSRISYRPDDDTEDGRITSF
jgi:hypothetical protein